MSAVSANLEVVQEELLRERAMRAQAKEVATARKKATQNAKVAVQREAYAARLSVALQKRLEAWDEGGVPFAVREPGIAKAPAPTMAPSPTEVSTAVESTEFFASEAANRIEQDLLALRSSNEATA